MKLLVDKTELRYLLEAKRDCIGYKTSSGVENTFAGIGYLASVAIAEYKNVGFLSGEAIKIVLIIIGVVFSIRGVAMIIKSVKEPYSQDDLYRDIEGLDEVTHPFSIIAIKDTFDNYANRFLLYYDERWDCKLFPSYRTVDNDEENIKTRLSNELKIESQAIKLEYKTYEIHKKYSISNEENRVYNHRAYKAVFEKFTDEMIQDEFEIDGKRFFWMTINDMEKDPRIMKVNSDVVGFIKRTVA